MIIEDGKGTGYKTEVDTTNRMHVRSVSESEEIHAIGQGDGYNINTGNISLSAAGTLIYIKNNEDRDLFIGAIALGVGSGTTSDIGEMTIIRQPTGGDLISDATAITMNQNRNAGSTKILSATIYQGKSSGTITGGDDIAIFYQGTSGRLFSTVNLVLSKGTSLAIKYDPKLSSGSVKVYCAIVCYLKELSS